MSSSDGASLVAAAVRAAILAKAPRRTVQAVAAAVTGAVVHRPLSRHRTASRVPAEEPAWPPTAAGGLSSDELLAALRADRQVKRRKKKERRRANRALRTNGVKAEDGASGDDANGTARFDVETADDLMPCPGGGGEVLSETVSSLEEPAWKARRVERRKAWAAARGRSVESISSDEFPYYRTPVFSDDDMGNNAAPGGAHGASGSEVMEHGDAATGGASGAPGPGQQRSRRRRQQRK